MTHLLVVPPARDPEAVLDWLVRLGAGTPYDAKQKLLRGAPFLLPPSDTVDEWAAHLRDAGLPAYAVHDDEFRLLPPVVDAAAFAFAPEGIVVRTADDRELVLPASAIEAVLRARRDVQQPKPASKPMPRFDPKAGENLCCYVLCALPDVLVRFELGHVDYAGLGPHQTAVTRQNHLALQTILENGSVGAWKDARLEALGGRLPPFPKGPQAAARIGLSNVEGPFEEAALLLCIAVRLSRRAG